MYKRRISAHTFNISIQITKILPLLILAVLTPAKRTKGTLQENLEVLRKPGAERVIHSIHEFYPFARQNLIDFIVESNVRLMGSLHKRPRPQIHNDTNKIRESHELIQFLQFPCFGSSSSFFEWQWSSVCVWSLVPMRSCLDGAKTWAKVQGQNREKPRTETCLFSFPLFSCFLFSFSWFFIEFLQGNDFPKYAPQISLETVKILPLSIFSRLTPEVDNRLRGINF